MAALSSIDSLSADFLKLRLDDFNHEDSWDKVGEGNFSIVYSANCTRLDEKVALKKLKKNVRSEEIEILTQTIVHKNIVGIKGVVEPCNANQSLCIAMEMLWVDLQKFRNNVPNPEKVWPHISSIVLGICCGLKYLHSLGFCHRDIKPQNVLLTETFIPKVGDFGLAKSAIQCEEMQPDAEDGNVSTDGSASTDNSILIPSGTMVYMSPQFMENPEKEFTEQDDVYSFALLVYKFITNVNLFHCEASSRVMGSQSSTFSLLKYYVCSIKWRHPLEELEKFSTPEVIKQVIDKAWKHEPSERKKFEDWTTILQKECEKYTPENISQSRRDLCRMVKNIMGDKDDSSRERLVTDDYGLLQELSNLLEIDDALGRNWQILADKLGFEANQIGLFEQKKDPTISVLLAAMRKGSKITAEMLIKVLKDLEREDAASLVQDWQNNGYKLVNHKNTDDQTDHVTSVFTIKHFQVFQKLKPLDTENPLGNDYRKLGDNLGLTLKEIQIIGQRSKSKTKAVLETACQRGKLKSYDHLIAILKDMERIDMSKEVEKLKANGIKSD